MAKKFSHVDPEGNPRMVDVGEKAVTRRVAKARSIVLLSEEILAHFDKDDIHTRKGPVFQTAIIAGVMAAKRTSELIPLCHPLPIDHVHIDIQLDEQRRVIVECTAAVIAKTGVEMEALTGASVAALTIYDMCKAFSHDIVIQQTRLVQKTGGKSDFHLEAEK